MPPHIPTFKPDEKRAYRVKEFCHLYGVSHAHAYKLAKTGRLRMVKVGGRTLIRREDAEALFITPGS
jgi:excisionase family DNA binding protein